ncbi:hypothetical protein Tco_0766509 [Tanacetum coccineum]
MAPLTGSLIDRSSILTDMILRRIEKMSEHICGFSMSSESKHTQDTGSSRSSSWFRQTDDIYCCQAIDPKLGDSTAGYEFKRDYTIIESPRAVVFLVKRLNSGMNTRFWTEKDVTRSKEFIAAIERRLKTRRIYRNLECFVGGRVRDIDYRLL